MYVASQRLPHSVEDVFAWHARPGAVVRLTPPWQPVRVGQEAASLRDGVALLEFPAGRTWVAEHQSDSYEENRHFADVLTSRPFVAPLNWRHDHSFTSTSSSSRMGTVLTDTVTTSVPKRILAPMFAFRHRQLARDLDAHAWAKALAPQPLTVAITGASGLIGRQLCAFLRGGGHRVIELARSAASGPDQRQWDPFSPAADLLEGVDAVVHLAGESIAGRFTEARQAEIRNSRIEPTRNLASLAAASGCSTFISASGIGYYGTEADERPVVESSPQGTGFLAEVVGEWEAAAAPAADGGLRTVQIRTGIVQSPQGGALKLQRPLFAAGLGGRLGSGEQWVSWIGIDDLLDVYLRALTDVRLEGPVNAVAPTPVNGKHYATTLAHVLRRPALIPTPSFGPKILLGSEGATEVALASQRVRPAKLERIGHEFRFPTLEPALRHLLGTTRR